MSKIEPNCKLRPIIWANMTRFLKQIGSLLASAHNFIHEIILFMSKAEIENWRKIESSYF